MDHAGLLMRCRAQSETPMHSRESGVKVVEGDERGPLGCLLHERCVQELQEEGSMLALQGAEDRHPQPFHCLRSPRYPGRYPGGQLHGATSAAPEATATLAAQESVVQLRGKLQEA